MGQQHGFATLSPHHASFTAEQAALLRSINRHHLILAPDKDRPGENMIKAARKHRKLLPERVLVADLLIDDADPASLLKQNPDFFAQRVARAVPLEY